MARDRSQGILGFFGLVIVCGALGYGAWTALTRPKSRGTAAAPRQTYTGPDSVGFLSVAGEGIELEVVTPTGLRISTAGMGVGKQKIPGAEATVDCPGITTPGSAEPDCTVSVNVSTPAPGDYTVITRATKLRAVILNVGWASASQAKRGAFDVRVQVAKGGATSFAIIVSREGVSQRSEPRPVSPGAP